MIKQSKKLQKKKYNLDERFRQLRTNIEFSQFDENLRIINVVSTFPNEGKSTVALNLAKTYAAQYRNVLLIDCDLRNPSIHKLMQISNEAGLSNLLTHFNAGNDITEFDEINEATYDNGHPFMVLTAGQRVPNPQELLSSKRFRQFLEQTKKQFSMIIIDCPPCMAVADAIPVCNAADGTLYVISAKDTDKAAAKEGLTEIKRNGANVIGAILTKAEQSHKHSGSYYYYDYDYGYGSSYGDEDDFE